MVTLTVQIEVDVEVHTASVPEELVGGDHWLPAEYECEVIVRGIEGDDVKPHEVPDWLSRAVDRAYAKYAREEAGA